MPRRLTPRQIAGRKNRARRGLLTPEGKEALRRHIAEQRPWERSTGPITAPGKARSRRNALRHGERASVLLPEAVLEARRLIRSGVGVVAEVYLVLEKLAVMDSRAAIDAANRLSLAHSRALRAALAADYQPGT